MQYTMSSWSYCDIGPTVADPTLSSRVAHTTSLPLLHFLKMGGGGRGEGGGKHH